MSGLCLSIETSCDDTSAAIVSDEGLVLGCLSVNQDLSHARFGGIVPEIASRNHSFQLLPLVDELMGRLGLKPEDLMGLAVTNRPGLIGSLIVGVTTAKTLALAWELPWVGVNHLEGHLIAPFLSDAQYQPPWNPWERPYLALTVSGGHTSIYRVDRFTQYTLLGATLDDAAGEAFDKFGKMLGLGFPGGVLVDRHSQGGDPSRYQFPRGLIGEDHLSMSFSGLKSAAGRLLEDLEEQGGVERIAQELPHLCASFQEAVADVLVAKLDLACQKTGIDSIVLTGGVSANSRLRQAVEEWCEKQRLRLAIPPLRYCTDNAAMIGWAGALRLASGEQAEWTTVASPHSWPSDFTMDPQ